jgi:SAM-dependent methyltransferase
MNKTRKQFLAALESAWLRVNDQFPFEEYIPARRKSSYFEMPLAVHRHLGEKAEILDFGAGSGDKTAMLALAGYQVTAFDDLGDYWYNLDDNRERILKFHRDMGVTFLLPEVDRKLPFEDNGYDGIILNNVIEHLHDSPRVLLNALIGKLKEGGILFIDVPNAANLRKRIDIARGRTNYPSMASFYWTPGSWRGHVREYVKQDLHELSEYLGMELVELSSHHYHLETLNSVARKTFVAICKCFPGLRESWLLACRKPPNWQPRLVPNEREFSATLRKQYFRYEFDKARWE